MITDFCTGRKIDIDALEEMISFAQESKEFCMRVFVNHCGTVGCLIGTTAIRKGLTIGTSTYKSPTTHEVEVFSAYGEKEINLSIMESRFLFMSHTMSFQSGKNWSSQEAASLSKEEAIARLRKFIAWKKKKAALLEQYDVARKREGNWMICNLSEGIAV